MLLGWHAGFAGEVGRFLGVIKRVIHFKNVLVVLDVHPYTFVVADKNTLHLSTFTATARRFKLFIWLGRPSSKKLTINGGSHLVPLSC